MLQGRTAPKSTGIAWSLNPAFTGDFGSLHTWGSKKFSAWTHCAERAMQAKSKPGEISRARSS